MKIAILGYGKMGKAIEKIAIDRNHEISLIVTNPSDLKNISTVDIAIDFSTPTAAFNNITTCLNNNISIIIGTTGWYKHYNKVLALCKQKNGAFIAATNFSLGVNIFFEINKKLAQLMAKLDSYNVTIEEIHHTEKLDAPSGTAITLANGIIEHSSKETWALDNTTLKNEIPITAKRIANVSGTHTVSYKSKTDTININHTAHNRNGFALGAVIAAEWLVNKKGVYTMKDVLNIG